MSQPNWEYLFVTVRDSDVLVGEALKEGLNSGERWDELDDIFRALADDTYDEYTGLLYDVFETTYMKKSSLSGTAVATQVVETLSVAIANYRAARTPLMKLDSWHYSGKAAYYSGEPGGETGPTIQDLLNRSTDYGSPYQGSIFAGQLHFFNLEHVLDVIGKAGWEMVAIDPVAYAAAEQVHVVFKRPFDSSHRDWEQPYDGSMDGEYFPTIAYIRASRRHRGMAGN